MKISRLLMPALTLAGALALAGCGGGSSTPAGGGGGGGGGGGDKPPECKADGVILNDAGDDCIPDPDYVDPEAASKERTADAKALMAALGRGTVAVTDPTEIPVLQAGTDADGSSFAESRITLKPTSKTVAALAGWQGKRYEGTEGTGAAKTTGEVVAYSNQGTAETEPFATAHGANADSAIKYYTFDGTGGQIGVLLFNSDRVSISGIDSDGRQDVDLADKFSGSYNGASGDYVCAGSDCFVATSGGKVTELTGTWWFTPGDGAMVPKTSDYLQFGWWVRKDEDGNPVDVGAFYRDSDPEADGLVPETIVANMAGTATYKGGAAGKFAISNPGSPSGDNSGHFTADAELNADFDDGTLGTLSGTIDNFTLNDTAKGPWVVRLEEENLATGGVTATDNTEARTSWSLDGTNFNPKGGGWTALLYENEGDDNSTPDSVIGGFEAAIGSTHHLEGAFGASQE